MATSTKSRSRSAAGAKRTNSSPRKSSASARNSSSSTTRKTNTSGARARPASRKTNTSGARAPASRSNSQSNGSRVATVAKAAVGALAGSAAVGVAAYAAVKKARRPRVLGMPMPRTVSPGKIDLKKVAKQVGNVAERVEKTSEDVRTASAQAKRVAKNLS
jgi:hypothetical protein